MRDIRKVWQGPLDKIVLSFSQLEPGWYQVRGSLSDKAWQAWCEEQGLAPEGGLNAALDIWLEGGLIEISGDVNVRLTQTCVRTLQTFTETRRIMLQERLLLDHSNETELTLTDKMLPVAAYILEHVLLHLDPNPLHPGVRHQPRGGLVWGDGWSSAEEKNPFSVLKDLQKTPKSGKCAPRLKHGPVRPVAVKKAS